MMTVEEMKNVDIRTVDPETLVDVREIEIDEGLPTVLQSSIRMVIIIPVCTRARSFRVLGRETGTAFRGRGSCLFLFPEFV